MPCVGAQAVRGIQQISSPGPQQRVCAPMPHAMDQGPAPRMQAHPGGLGPLGPPTGTGALQAGYAPGVGHSLGPSAIGPPFVSFGPYGPSYSGYHDGAGAHLGHQPAGLYSGYSIPPGPLALGSPGPSLFPTQGAFPLVQVGGHSVARAHSGWGPVPSAFFYSGMPYAPLQHQGYPVEPAGIGAGQPPLYRAQAGPSGGLLGDWEGPQDEHGANYKQDPSGPQAS